VRKPFPLLVHESYFANLASLREERDQQGDQTGEDQYADERDADGRQEQLRRVSRLEVEVHDHDDDREHEEEPADDDVGLGHGLEIGVSDPDGQAECAELGDGSDEHHPDVRSTAAAMALAELGQPVVAGLVERGDVGGGLHGNSFH